MLLPGSGINLVGDGRVTGVFYAGYQMLPCVSPCTTGLSTCIHMVFYRQNGVLSVYQ